MSTAQSPQPEDTARTPGPAIPGPAGGARTSGEPDRLPTAPTTPAPGARPRLSRRVRRLLVGLVAGALSWGVSALLSPEDGALRQFAAALLCAGAAVTVQYALDLDRRGEEQARRTEDALAETAAAVRDGLRRHDDELRAALARHAEDMRQLLENLPRPAQGDRDDAVRPQLDRVRLDGVPELATSFAEVLAPGPPILFTFVRLEMKRVVGQLTDLTNLSAECPGENHDWMLTLTRAAEQSICATSTSVDREFWNSEPASRYLQAQQEAIEEQGVSVRRLFLLESARELDDRLLRLCEEQELLRIEVRVAVLPELPPHIQRGTTNDFIVYDEEVSFEIEQDLRDVNVRTRLNARQDHVQDRMKRFRELWDAGMSVRELEVRVDDEEDGTWMVDRA
ncbi:hypothetical protein AB0L35_01245 [Streptomyces sp. NPDC052309]|uniref:hypothetical protein n=1 Tax=Streptomyces sp. NPDC052309 TaxID=3155421 RepID=UPI003443B579